VTLRTDPQIRGFLVRLLRGEPVLIHPPRARRLQRQLSPSELAVVVEQALEHAVSFRDRLAGKSLFSGLKQRHLKLSAADKKFNERILRSRGAGRPKTAFSRDGFALAIHRTLRTPRPLRNRKAGCRPGLLPVDCFGFVRAEQLTRAIVWFLSPRGPRSLNIGAVRSRFVSHLRQKGLRGTAAIYLDDVRRTRRLRRDQQH
jgi:hypothetical protein